MEKIIPTTNRKTMEPTLETTFNYTAIVAPIAFFLGGIVIVLLLNKFIGKNQGPSKTL
ncbi:hypothetical protein Plut_2004 [Pelodictyon luteolum DSM 273]|uniref:Uncharacterized protein n=1 Tax=Chlorobium luteolum (strain DSM 273 / BCRC 81028 / 2530) TaxID=319225 RepID=Q3B1D5_CHLL3|nr:hypothetical protein Plut_2004 [Pelodictyon luteolum DSM 273]